MAGIPSRSELYRLYWIEEKTLAEIGEIYNRSNRTVCEWMRIRGVRARTRKEQSFKIIDGVVHKKCNGPLHNCTWLPVTEFYKDRGNAKKKAMFRSVCKRCDAAAKNSEPLVPVSKFHFAFEELVRRLGMMESARRVGITYEAFHDIYYKKEDRMKSRTARSAIQALAAARESNEVRHRDSIRHGAYLRGREEKTPVSRHDFYKPTGDSDNEIRKKYRNENIEHERELDRARKARKKAEV